jgi:uncharacterized RDD family membrane protein YckC
MPLDLDRVIGESEAGPAAPASPGAPAGDVPLFAQVCGEADEPRATRRTAGGSGDLGRQQQSRDEVPMITTPSRPRAPLGVRRATPEIPRARPPRPTPASGDTLFEASPVRSGAGDAVSGGARTAAGDPLAGRFSRIMAGLIDASLLLALDAVVLYFTSRLTGADALQLPLLPLAAFLLLLNGGYFIAFTSVGGQSIGKMAFGLKVVAQDEESVALGRATLRTIAYILSALPLGAGFLAGIFSADRLAFHDRLAHTRVVRPSST